MFNDGNQIQVNGCLTRIATLFPKLAPQPKPKETVRTPAIKRPKEQIDNYTIQLASYQSRKYADRAAEKLKKRGLSPLILSKGEYIVLCVGNFSDKKTAYSLLAEFKKQYRDCFVRRL